MMKVVPASLLAGALVALGGCGSQLATGFQRDVSELRSHLSGSRYGAIAVSDQTLDWRIHWDAASQEEAARVALAECAHASCRVILGFGPEQCGTVALGPAGFAAGVGGSGAEAEMIARTTCSANGAACEVAPAGCNS